MGRKSHKFNIITMRIIIFSVQIPLDMGTRSNISWTTHNSIWTLCYFGYWSVAAIRDRLFI